MRIPLLLSTLVFVAICTTAAKADLIDEFSGFEFVAEVGVTGHQSSYAADTRAGLSVTGPTISTVLPLFDENLVSYPPSGTVPSPGGSLGLSLDQGVLGVKVEADQLVLRLATALDPTTGLYYSGYNAWYGEGDLFLSVADSAGVSHYALLNAWPRDAQGNPRELNGGHFIAPRTFHVAGGAGGTSLEGHLIELSDDADVTTTGGAGAYHSGNAPAGLDLRAYAASGTDRGSANLTHHSVTHADRTWYLQTWTVALGALSADRPFDIALHAVPSCGNDQTGMLTTVPEPGTALLSLLTIGLAGAPRRA